MKSVEAEGRSIDDAIERALQHLGVSRDKVDIEILSNSPRGLFGLGGQRAKVRATLRRPLAFDAPSDGGPRPTAALPLPAPAAAVPRRQSARPQQSAAPRAATPAPPASPEPFDGAGVERARTVLGEIVRLMGSDATVGVARDPEGVRLVITGDRSGALIGRRGQTLDALEYVLNRIMANDEESSGRLLVDLEGYRLRRQQGLEELVHRVAERVRRRGKPATLNPMSPRDRRIVHMALQGDPTLTTRSVGTGFYRKVVIVPATAGRPNRSRAEPAE
jgi:spoIIIJ-associated protein